MKKLVLLFDGQNFYDAMLAFVQQLHLLSPVQVTAVFAPTASLANLWSYAAAGEGELPMRLLRETAENSDEVQEHIRRLEQFCQAARIPCRIHNAGNDPALPALRRESRFADLVLLSSDAFYSEVLATGAHRYLHDALHDTECPVLVLPEHSAFPRNILLAYNGSRESVYALKQFAYLFPEWTELKTTVVHAGKSATSDLPEKELIMELVQAHYKRVAWQSKASTDRPGLGNWIEQQPDALLVAGAFSRNWLSELFRDSFCAGLVRRHRLPVFIAHR